MVDAVGGLNTIDISCGYGHVVFIVQSEGLNSTAQTKLNAFPVLPAPTSVSTSSKEKSKESKKRVSVGDKEVKGKKAKGK